ncbi:MULTISPECIES: hypothetical protein [Xanthomonas]|uniref:hypothetical protein n=1 Tax=Xanthomonas TaxID=338 RepID=UPI000E1F6D75|nr:MULTISPECIES: hypothetical protein [Xanthomonas]
MRATVNSHQLADALKHSAAPAKSTMELLQFARITAGHGELQIETTDTQVYTRMTIAADVQDDGQLLLHESTLRTIAAGGGKLDLRADGQVVRGRSRYRVGTHPDPSSLPDAERMKWEPIELPATMLAEAVSHVQHAPDDKDVRAYCRVVFVETGKVWATDGKLMARRAIAYTGPKFCLPVYQLGRITDALGQPEAVISVGRAAGVAHVLALRIESAAMCLIVRMVEAQVVLDIEKLVPDPAAAAARVRFDRKAMIEALRRFVPFSAWGGEKGINHCIALELLPDAVVMTDKAGENVEHLTDAGAAIEHSGTIRVGLHPRQLQQILSAIRTDQVVLHLAREVKGAALVQPLDVSPDEIAHVVMPFTL